MGLVWSEHHAMRSVFTFLERCFDKGEGKIVREREAWLRYGYWGIEFFPSYFSTCLLMFPFLNRMTVSLLSCEHSLFSVSVYAYI